MGLPLNIQLVFDQSGRPEELVTNSSPVVTEDLLSILGIECLIDLALVSGISKKDLKENVLDYIDRTEAHSHLNLKTKFNYSTTH